MVSIYYRVLSVKSFARMLVVEMFFMGFLSFIIGCFLGSFLSEVLRMLILQFFSKDFQFVFHFSIETMGSTFLYFLFMWILTLWKERRTIMKVNIKELLYEENKNDPVVKHRFIKWMVLLIACICFIFWNHRHKKGHIGYALWRRIASLINRCHIIGYK